MPIHDIKILSFIEQNTSAVAGPKGEVIVNDNWTTELCTGITEVNVQSSSGLNFATRLFK